MNVNEFSPSGLLDRVRSARQRLADEAPEVVEGRVTASVGTVLRAELPDARVGDLCRIEVPGLGWLDAEAIGFDDRGMMLMPFGSAQGVSLHARVRSAGTSITVPAGKAVRGRIIDAIGNPIDHGPSLNDAERVPLMAPPPNPMDRAMVAEATPLGIPVIDGILTIGRGQRVGIAAPAGAGKSTLLSLIAEQIKADYVVLALIGERGREVREFAEKLLRRCGDRVTIVVSTSDQPSLMRMKAAHTASAIAEAAARDGSHVVLMVDSVTRFARALREIGLAAGEPAGRQGFPASVFERLPRLFERAGNRERGSITAFYTILVTGDDLTEPVTDESISLLDGHIVLSRELKNRGHRPAIDVLRSESRLLGALVTPRHRDIVDRFRAIIELYEKNYDRIAMNRYQPQLPKEQDLFARAEEAIAFLQEPHPRRTLDETVAILDAICFGAR